MSGVTEATRVVRAGGRVVFVRRWSARAPLARVLEATRLERTPELHPLIVAVLDFRERGDASECVLDERLALGPLRIPNKYRATRELLEASAGAARLALGAEAALGTTLRHELALRCVGERTEVEHVVDVRAPRVLRCFVARTAARAHDEWVARVVAWAERGA